MRVNEPVTIRDPEAAARFFATSARSPDRIHVLLVSFGDRAMLDRAAQIFRLSLGVLGLQPPIGIAAFQDREGLWHGYLGIAPLPPEHHRRVLAGMVMASGSARIKTNNGFEFVATMVLRPKGAPHDVEQIGRAVMALCGADEVTVTMFQQKPEEIMNQEQRYEQRSGL